MPEPTFSFLALNAVTEPGGAEPLMIEEEVSGRPLQPAPVGYLLDSGAGRTLAMVQDTAARALPVQLLSSVPLTVDGSGVTQPISALNLPLPQGAATADNQSTSIGHLSTLAGAVAAGEVAVRAGTNLNTSTLLTQSTWTTRIGEVAASPTENTLLGRIKAVQDLLAGTLTTAVAGAVNTELTLDDLDTGAGTDDQAIVGLALAESGGHVLVGSGNPMPVSLTATVTNNIEASTEDLDEIRDFLQALHHFEDSPHASSEAGIMMLAVRNDAPGSLVSANGDYSPLAVDSSGRLYVNGSGVNQPVVVVGALPGVAGDIAHDAADSGNPIKVGFVARTAHPTAVANGDRADAYADTRGRQVIVGNVARGLKVRNRIALSNTTETTLLAAGGVGVSHDLTRVVVANDSDTDVRVDLRDATGGTVRESVVALAGQTQGFACPLDPSEQTAANNAWTAQLSAAPASGSVYVTGQAVKN